MPFPARKSPGKKISLIITNLDPEKKTWAEKFAKCSQKRGKFLPSGEKAGKSALTYSGEALLACEQNDQAV